MKKNNFAQFIGSINWEKTGGLVPAIIQNAATGQVIMLGFMNQQALRKTMTTQKVWFYSRTKKRLWMKGETSKNILKVVNVMIDCDNDTVLVKAQPSGVMCHTGGRTCFRNDTLPELGVIIELFELIKKRKLDRPKGSYTSSLLDNGLGAICEKIYEEAAEVVCAAKKETTKRLVEESVDLLYHLLVLLVDQNIEIQDLVNEFKRRG